MFFLNKIMMCLILVVFQLFCNTTLPKPSAEKKSAIAITVAVDVHYSLFSISNIKPEKILFIRLDSKEDTLEKKSVLFSTYNYESLWGNLRKDSTDNFLLDLDPGIYAAVAAYGLTSSYIHCLILFPEEMIKKTIIEVKLDSMMYIGKYILNRSSYLKDLADADNIQKYYLKFLIDLFYRDHSKMIRLITVGPSLKEVRQSEKDEKAFLLKYQNLFKNTDWIEKINNRLKFLNKSGL